MVFSILTRLPILQASLHWNSSYCVSMITSSMSSDHRNYHVSARDVLKQIFRTNSLPFQWVPISIWNLNPIPIFSIEQRRPEKPGHRLWSSTVDSRLRLTTSDEDIAERSHWRALTSATWQSSSTRYEGADPWRHLYTFSRAAHFKAIFFGAFSQWRRPYWSWWMSGVMWWIFTGEKMSQAASFIGDWSRDKRYDETKTPATGALA